MPEVILPVPDLEPAGDGPVHTRIEDWLEDLIVSGRLSPGDKLPAEVGIAAMLGVSRMTLRQALATLTDKGLLERRRGRHGGNFVTRPRFDYSLDGLPGLTAQMRKARVAPGALVVSANTRSATAAERAALQLSRSGQVHEIIRVRAANGTPVTLEETMLPAGLFPGMLALDLTASLYAIMDRGYDLSPASAEEVIEPVVATSEQARVLQIAVGQPLLVITRTSYAADGSPVEFARDHFRPDRTRVVVRTQADRAPAMSLRSVSSREARRPAQ